MQEGRPVIVVGIALVPELDENTLFHAQTLARRLGFGLRLVHAVDWYESSPWISHLPGEGTQADIAEKARRLALEDARRRLKDIATRVGGGEALPHNLLEGSAVRGLIADAMAHHAVMIVCGARPTRHRFATQGLSTAIGLMQDSPIPVLVINQEVAVDFTKPHLRILLADDLEFESRDAVATAFALASTLGHATLKHVHVYGSLGQQLKNGLTRFWEVAGGLFDKNVRPGDLYRAEVQRRKDALAVRAEPFLAELKERGGDYLSTLVEGSPGEMLLEEAEAYDVDLVVYGHHSTLHTAPFRLGHVAWREMLDQRAAVLTVPHGARQLIDAFAVEPFGGAA